MTFKTAVVWSALVHLGLLILQPPNGLTPPRAALRSLEVSYLPVPPESSLPAPPAPVHAVPPEPAAESRSVKVAHASEGGPPVLPPTSGPMRAPVEPVVSEPPRPTPRPPSSVAALPDWEFSALQHKEQIRKHLKACFHYPELSLEGTVRLRLVLTAEGSLQTVEVLEASDLRLIQLALRDARSAAPYPRFLPAMRHRMASYEFLVRYEPD